jgi:hypothetical protein
MSENSWLRRASQSTLDSFRSLLMTTSTTPFGSAGQESLTSGTNVQLPMPRDVSQSQNAGSDPQVPSHSQSRHDGAIEGRHVQPAGGNGRSLWQFGAQLRHSRAPDPHAPLSRNSSPGFPNGMYFASDFMIGAGMVILQPSTMKVVVVYDAQTKSWFLPKGRKDVGESLEQAALREAYEEVRSIHLCASVLA